MDKNKDEAIELRRELELLKKTTEEEIARKTRESEAELAKIKEKARQLIEGARATSEFVFKELDSVRKKQDSKKFAQELEKAKQEVRNQLKNGSDLYYELESPQIEEDDDYVLPRPLKIGDIVYLLDYKQEGEVLDLPDKNDSVKVKSGILTTKVKLSRVRLLEKHLKKKAENKGANSVVKKPSVSTFKQEIDLRGKTGDEAWYELDKYLDDALMAGLHSVRIIHGKGTGALRKAIQEELRRDRRIKSYRNGEFGEGDFGVTVAELK
jgi:DNA mismatch repair protein MutS2